MRALLRWAPAGALAAWVGLHVAGLAAGGLWRVAAWYLSLQLLPLGALPFVLGALAWAAWHRRLGAPGATTLALGALGLLPGVLGTGFHTVRYPFADLAATAPAATVRLPLDGPVRVVWGGDTLETNYHAADPAQRWAYDLVVEPAGVGSHRLEDYGCYGRPVLAPADGVVSHVVEGVPDTDLAAPAPDLLNPAGNHVALRLASDTYLVVAHLKPGSVAVRVGDRVAEGQPLGACGNSGNSSEPHVHLHHQRHDPEKLQLLSEGLPLFFRDHGGAPMPLGGVAVDGESFRFTGDVVEHRPAGPGE